MEDSGHWLNWATLSVFSLVVISTVASFAMIYLIVGERRSSREREIDLHNRLDKYVAMILTMRIASEAENEHVGMAALNRIMDQVPRVAAVAAGEKKPKQPEVKTGMVGGMRLG